MSDSIITNTPNLYSSSANGSYANGNSTSTNGNDVSGWFKWFFFNKYMLIAIILAYLGFNLFSYFGSLLKVIMDIIRPLVSLLGYTTAETAKEVIKVAKVGSKDVIDVAAGVTTGGINVLEKGLTGGSSSKKNTNGSGAQTSGAPTKPPKAAFPIPDDAGSRTQANKAKSKSGYCYIGEDRGFRSCIQVNDTDTCMSGDIFPTQEICINPSLRQ
jgi:hypothetical protein